MVGISSIMKPAEGLTDSVVFKILEAEAEAFFPDIA
jgi:hypothetical protein